MVAHFTHARLGRRFKRNKSRNAQKRFVLPRAWNPHSTDWEEEFFEKLFASGELSKDDFVLGRDYREETQAHILGHPRGVPYIYSDLGKSEKTGVESDKYERFHARKDMAAMVAFRKTMAGSSLEWIEKTDTTTVFARGTRGLVVLNKEL